MSPNTEIPRKAQPFISYNATLIERVDLSHNLAIFRVRPDGNTPDDAQANVPDFEAGQYIVIGANNTECPEKGSVRRAYSIASSPQEKRWLEFYVRLVEKPTSDNPLTPLLWKMQPGDRLHLGRKIVGHFTLSRTIGKQDDRWKIFVAAGTGLAPFVSILRSLMADGDTGLEKVILLHGASRPHELGYKKELEEVLNHTCQRYFPTVSRHEQHPEWEGSRGRVETFFDAEELETLEERLGMACGEIIPSRSVVYICGLHGTILQTLGRLLHRGFVPNDAKVRKALGISKELPSSLFFEQYDSSPLFGSEDELVASLKAQFLKSQNGDRQENVEPQEGSCPLKP